MENTEMAELITERQAQGIVMVRRGDWFEAFGDDAKVLAEVIDVVLTSRGTSLGERVPMAGIPAHAADGYVARAEQLAGIRIELIG